MKPLDMKKVKENKDYDALALIGMKGLQVEAEERGYDAFIVSMLVTALDDALRNRWVVEDSETLQMFDNFMKHLHPILSAQLAILKAADRS